MCEGDGFIMMALRLYDNIRAIVHRLISTTTQHQCALFAF
jgi:hypothetical protein